MRVSRHISNLFRKKSYAVKRNFFLINATKCSLKKQLFPDSLSKSVLSRVLSLRSTETLKRLRKTLTKYPPVITPSYEKRRVLILLSFSYKYEGYIMLFFGSPTRTSSFNWTDSWFLHFSFLLSVNHFFFISFFLFQQSFSATKLLIE